MCRWLVALLLLAGSLGAAPHAAISTPATAAPGVLVRVDTTGTISDQPPHVVLYAPVDGSEPLFRADRSVAGFILPGPGQYFFVVIASGKVDATAALTYDIAKSVTVVSASPPTPGPAPLPPVVPSPPPLPPIPVPPPIPTPTPQSAPFTEAYRTYESRMNFTLAAISVDVRAGKIATKQAFLDALKAHSAPFAKAVDDLFAAKMDAAGKITDPVGIADAIDAAVKGASAP